MEKYTKFLSLFFLLVSIKSILQWSSLATNIINNVSILFSALTRMFPKPTFAP